jgi:BirA family transcriptional regulator, biotin operon repressor / biotin---[acetyl-CoA-carboxylase] ligase
MTSHVRLALVRARLESALGRPWSGIEIVDATESTNADLIDAAPTRPAGAVLVAEYQRTGRGRLDRRWASPPRAGLTFSVLLRPSASASLWGWLPLLTGVAVRDAVAELTGVDAALKWPNDVLLGGARRKAAGILAQVVGDAAVVGVGLNVTTTAEELPVDTATSLAIEGGAAPDRTELLVAILAELGARYMQWDAAGGDAEVSGLAGDYRNWCATIGRDVVVSGTDGDSYEGRATGVDADGRLVLTSDGRQRLVAAGDVRHLR